MTKWNKYPETHPELYRDVLVLRKNGEIHVAHWGPECEEYAEWKIFVEDLPEGSEDWWMSHDLWDVVYWRLLPEKPAAYRKIGRKV